MGLTKDGVVTPLEVIVCGIAFLGMAIDHITTVVVLQHPRIYETNPLTVWLMASGWWLSFDILVTTLTCVGSILVSRMLSRTETFAKNYWILTLTPVVYGVLRFITGIHNIILYLDVI